MSFGTDKPRYYERNGKKLPSATTILSLLDKPALKQWAANCTAEYVAEQCLSQDTPVPVGYLKDVLKDAKGAWRDVSRKAMDIGTQVHDAIEEWLKSGSEPENPSLEVASAFAAFHEWRKSVDLQPIHTEIAVYGVGYAGRADLVARVNGDVYLLDWKSSNAVYDDYRLQTAAYRDAFNDMMLGFPDEPIITHNGVVRLDKKTGIPEFVDCSDTYERDIEAFMCLVNFWNVIRKGK